MDEVNSVQELIERTAQMPLDRMRFFINEDRQEPKCFGIYHDDAGDRWVVYKNKADGSRAVRYSGPDEACAANELWQKIQSEIALRRPQKADPKRRRLRRIVIAAVVAVAIAIVAAVAIHEMRQPRRGYYYVDDDLYYYQDSDWYYYYDGCWDYYDAPDGDDWYGDGYYGETRPDTIDSPEAFEYSGYYEEPKRDDRNDSDRDVFDSWDIGDTNWDSDW